MKKSSVAAIVCLIFWNNTLNSQAYEPATIQAEYVGIMQGYKAQDVYDAFSDIYGRAAYFGGVQRNLQATGRPESELRPLWPKSNLTGELINQIYDLDEFRLFRLAHQNEFENKDIENSSNLSIVNTEFDFERQRKNISSIRGKQYVIAPWLWFGAYDFKRSCMPLAGTGDNENQRAILGNHIFHLSRGYANGRGDSDYELGDPILQKGLCINMPPEIAEKYFKFENYNLTDTAQVPIILFKVTSEKYFPFKCSKFKSDLERFGKCKIDNWEKRKVKRLVITPLKYYVKTGDQIFKNYK